MPFGGKVLARGNSGEQPATLDGAGHGPRLCPMRLEAEEAAIIFRITDQDERIGIRRFGSGDHALHHHPADAAALEIARHCYRTDQDQRHFKIERHRPTLQRTEQITVIIECREGKLRDGGHPVTNAIGGAPPPIDAKCLVQQGVYLGGVCRVQRFD